MNKKSRLDKIIMGFVIWSAVAGAIWAWLNSKKWQELKKEFVNKINQSKPSFWHFLNRLFFKKK